MLAIFEWYRRRTGDHWLWIGWGVWIQTDECLKSDLEDGSHCERWFNGKPQRTWVWCPTCERDLCSQETLVRATPDGAVTYHCHKCDLVSVWDFNPPAPVLIRKHAYVDPWKSSLRIVS